MTNSDDATANGFSNVPLTEPYEFVLDEEREVVLAIVEEMANVHGCVPTDLEPLYFDVDPATLEQVLDGPDRQQYRFVSNGIAVTVCGDGRIVFRRAEEYYSSR